MIYILIENCQIKHFDELVEIAKNQTAKSKK